MVGYYKRVGQLLVQDMAVSMGVMLAMQEYLETLQEQKAKSGP
jgi:hypothetical protein